jgi:hypothetical protein
MFFQLVEAKPMRVIEKPCSGRPLGGCTRGSSLGLPGALKKEPTALIGDEVDVSLIRSLGW